MRNTCKCHNCSVSAMKVLQNWKCSQQVVAKVVISFLALLGISEKWL